MQAEGMSRALGGEPVHIDLPYKYNNTGLSPVLPLSLNDEVQKLLGDFDDPESFHNFPHYSTFSSHLTKTEINLLANFTAWAVATPSNSEMFAGLFKETP